VRPATVALVVVFPRETGADGGRERLRWRAWMSLPPFRSALPGLPRLAKSARRGESPARPGWRSIAGWVTAGAIERPSLSLGVGGTDPSTALRADCVRPYTLGI